MCVLFMHACMFAHNKDRHFQGLGNQGCIVLCFCCMFGLFLYGVGVDLGRHHRTMAASQLPP